MSPRSFTDQSLTSKTQGCQRLAALLGWQPCVWQPCLMHRPHGSVTITPIPPVPARSPPGRPESSTMLCSRRHFLTGSTMGLGSLALASLLRDEGLLAAPAKPLLEEPT